LKKIAALSTNSAKTDGAKTDSRTHKADCPCLHNQPATQNHNQTQNTTNRISL